jgi:NTP pyrophosphatase (non-canonical NTP hydrolase)
MADRSIRVVALCAFRDGDRVLVGPSGVVEPGEHGAQTVGRLLGGTAGRVRRVGPLEHVSPEGHEIVLVYEADLPPAWQRSEQPPAAYPGLNELLQPMPYSALPAYQQRVADFVDAAGIRTGVESRALDLASEVGEVAKEVLKATRYGDAPFDTPPSWSDEVADVFFSLACLANATNVNLDDALEGALTKYRDRLMKSGDVGSGR